MQLPASYITMCHFYSLFQAKSVMEKRKHNVHSSTRSSRFTRANSSTINLGRPKHSISSNFQSQYSGFENSGWQGQSHQQNPDKETSSHHICFEENPTVNESFETDDETEIQICESSNHLGFIFLSREGGNNLSVSLES